ncbi:hypothetical protein WR30_11280 [Burkholderia contaminans FFH2055]|uniref:hypothetical protein n=1 Tax=Burkholderia contaminans TaxID=488447 RepID=UPI0006252C7D|nr:hypothetical protein [Burkholderia contaminans]KKL38632.1 hypothetical protein WR30_11280 [Burkholderia contaminans FFH2055]MEB4631182.1 hypothetical protein [Burkholderia contaminans]MEB4637970.1 hypothetical protein [Burkholderia contaminans]MEB4653054.1 hypothetical protein [Burkholderia contaminans]MEB4658090.1 hypothetical protein [Burkholderia contaminans]
MSTIYVQFSDENGTAIVSIFSAPQNATAYSNLGEVTEADARYATYYNALPAWAQQGMLQPSTDA